MAAISVGLTANAASITIFNTGVDASGTAIVPGFSDPHWIAGVVLSSGIIPSTWAFNGSTSVWIAKSYSIHPGAAPYTFTQSFSLSGFDPTSAVLSGTWFIDDQGTLNLNGHTVATASADYQGEPFTINDTNGFFVSGTNTLSVTMTSSDNNYDGVRVVVSGTANPVSTTPEPASIVLFLCGSLVILSPRLCRLR